LVEHGRNGWAYDPGNEDGLREALRAALLADPDELDGMSRAARATAERFSDEPIAGKFAATIREFLRDD
jgi:glycosyltransferase involved in cell wall biosynthesis